MKKEELCTTAEAAELLSCTDETIRNYRRRKRLHHVRLPNDRVLLLRKEVLKLRDELLVQRRKPAEVVVQCSLPLPDYEPPKTPSLREDLDLEWFSDAVQKAVAEYVAAKAKAKKERAKP